EPRAYVAAFYGRRPRIVADAPRSPAVDGFGQRAEEATMSAGTEPQTKTSDEALAAELHELEAQEKALERRTRSLEVSNPLALLFSILALALAAGALIFALNKDGGSNGARGSVAPVAAGVSGTAAQGNGMMMGGGSAQSGRMMNSAGS